MEHGTIESMKTALLTSPRNCDRFCSGDVAKDADEALRTMLDEMRDDGDFGFRGVANYLLSPVKELRDSSDEKMEAVGKRSEPKGRRRKMKDHWGANENDIIADRATSPLIKMLALCQEILDDCGECTDGKLADALNLTDVEERLIDALAECSAYQKQRNNELVKTDERVGKP